MKIRSLKKKKKWQGQTVLLRVDFNVPVSNGRIGEDYRITAALPTIKYLREHGARLLIISHWGDPKTSDQALSTKPLARRLQKLLAAPVKFVPDLLGPKAQKAVANLQEGEIVFLENLRSQPGIIGSCMIICKTVLSPFREMRNIFGMLNQ